MDRKRRMQTDGFFQVKRMPIKQKLFNCAECGDLNGLKRIAFFSSKDQGCNAIDILEFRVGLQGDTSPW